MNHFHDREYLALLNEIMDMGTDGDDRTGVGTRSLFGTIMKFDLQHGFPLLTTKRVHYRAAFNEFIWMVIKGSTDLAWMQEKGHTFWDAWALPDNTIGKGYGYQFRRGTDQVATALEMLKTQPESRRNIIELWNVDDLPEMALVPCHKMTHFKVNNGRLDCLMYQRSVDTFIGLPFNLAFYGLFTHVMAHLAGLEVGTFVWMGGDTHIYNNHFDQVKLLLSREPEASPTFRIAPDAPTTLDGDWTTDHFILEGYEPHPAIRAPVAV